MKTNVICKDCGYDISWHDEYGMLSPAFGGQAPCDYMAGYLATEKQGEDYDFADAKDNPYILSGEELDRAEAAARSR